MHWKSKETKTIHNAQYTIHNTIKHLMLRYGSSVYIRTLWYGNGFLHHSSDPSMWYLHNNIIDSNRIEGDQYIYIYIAVAGSSSSSWSIPISGYNFFQRMTIEVEENIGHAQLLGHPYLINSNVNFTYGMVISRDIHNKVWSNLLVIYMHACITWFYVNTRFE